MKDLIGRTFLITGGNTGIGLATARELALRGGQVHIAGRSEDRGRAAVNEITRTTGNDHVGFFPLDLADLTSVRRCAENFLARDEPLHCLINNAGVGGGQRGVTRDGFELIFGINHLGHFLLTTALLDRLVASAPARVVTLSSDFHRKAEGIDFDALRKPTRSITGMREYAVSKLCNVLFTRELARRTADRGVTTYALHPGVVASDIWRKVPWPIRPLIKLRMSSTSDGARTSVYCATSPVVAGESGRYYEDCRERQPSTVATEDLGRSLWESSETWTAV